MGDRTEFGFPMCGPPKEHAPFGTGDTDKYAGHVQSYVVDIDKASPTEVRITDPKTGGQKGRKIERTDLLPTDALLAIAKQFGFGASKYEDRNWEKGYDWSLSYGALLRHLFAWWNGEDIDPESGMSHLLAAGFHILVLTAFEIRGIGTDDRPGAKHD